MPLVLWWDTYKDAEHSRLMTGMKVTGTYKLKHKQLHLDTHASTQGLISLLTAVLALGFVCVHECMCGCV